MSNPEMITKIALQCQHNDNNDDDDNNNNNNIIIIIIIIIIITKQSVIGNTIHMTSL